MQVVTGTHTRLSVFQKGGGGPVATKYMSPSGNPKSSSSMMDDV
jgi:hypothetical protein